MNNFGKGKAKAGLILSIISTSLWVLAITLLASLFGYAASNSDELREELEQLEQMSDAELEAAVQYMLDAL